MEKKYSVDELTESIIKEYQLSMNSEHNKATYKAQIYRVLHDTKIWDEAKTENNEKSKTKSNAKHFTESQKQRLLASPKMYDYVRNNSESEEIRNRKRYKDVQAEIKRRCNIHIAHVESLAENQGTNHNTPDISDKELNDAMDKMMLSAIFELYFTPINMDLLRNDLYKVTFTSESNLDEETIDAEDRLAHPEGYYYNRKEDNH